MPTTSRVGRVTEAVDLDCDAACCGAAAARVEVVPLEPLASAMPTAAATIRINVPTAVRRRRRSCRCRAARRPAVREDGSSIRYRGLTRDVLMRRAMLATRRAGPGATQLTAGNHEQRPEPGGQHDIAGERDTATEVRRRRNVAPGNDAQELRAVDGDRHAGLGTALAADYAAPTAVELELVDRWRSVSTAGYPPAHRSSGSGSTLAVEPPRHLREDRFDDQATGGRAHQLLESGLRCAPHQFGEAIHNLHLSLVEQPHDRLHRRD